MRNMILLYAITVSLIVTVSNAALVNIGDTEIFELDANLNLRGWSGGVPVPISLTAGEYELKFLDTNPDRTAWKYGPYVGAEYWVGGVRIDEQDNRDNAIFDGSEYYGIGASPEAAYADATANSALIHQFTVPNDVIGHAYIRDVDNNNTGGLTIQISKVIPEPSSISLIALIGAGGHAIRRRFLI